KGSALMKRKLVNALFAGLDRLLSDAVNAIDAVGQFETVQVQDGGFRQHVVQRDSHAVALGGLDGGPRHAVVVAPHVDPGAGEELAPGRCGVKIILLDAIFDGWLGDPVVRRYDGHGSKAWLPQPRHEFAAIRGAAHWTAASRLMSRIVFMVGVRMRWLGRE